MGKLIKPTGKAYNIPVGMLISVLSSMLITVMSSMVLANYIHLEKITWDRAGYWIMAILFIASFIGGKSAIYAVKRQKMFISMMSGLLYWGLLLCITALLFGGNFGAVWETAAIILSGCVTAALLMSPTIKNSKKSGHIYR